MAVPTQPPNGLRPRLKPAFRGWRDTVAELDPGRKYKEYAEAGLDLAERNLKVLEEIAETLKRIETILDDATRAEPEKPEGPLPDATGD